MPRDFIWANLRIFNRLRLMDVPPRKLGRAVCILEKGRAGYTPEKILLTVRNTDSGAIRWAAAQREILSFHLVVVRGVGQYREKLTFGWTKFRGAGHHHLRIGHSYRLAVIRSVDRSPEDRHRLYTRKLHLCDRRGCQATPPRCLPYRKQTRKINQKSNPLFLEQVPARRRELPKRQKR